MDKKTLLQFLLLKLSRNDAPFFSQFAKQWISKDIPSYGSQSKHAKIAIHWFGKYVYIIVSITFQNRSYIPYLLVYKSTSCISRPPFSRSKIEFLIISGKTNEIHSNRNFPKRQSFLPENVLKTRWIKKSRGFNHTQWSLSRSQFTHMRALRFTWEVFYDIWE